MSSLLTLPFSYLLWHYTVAWGDLIRLYQNFTWFFWNFFSVELLVRTLFSPWHRIREGSKKSAGGFLGNFIVNTTLRFIGFFARLFVIAGGLMSIIVLSVLFACFLLVWLCMPIFVVALIVIGIVGLFSF